MASQLATLRKDLPAPGLIRIVREQFSKITDTRRQGSVRFTLPDTLCAALAMSQFKVSGPPRPVLCYSGQSDFFRSGAGWA